MEDLGWISASIASLFAGVMSLLSYIRTSRVDSLRSKLNSRNRELLEALTNIKKLLEIEKEHVNRQKLNRYQKYQIRGSHNKLSPNAEPTRLITRLTELESEINSN